MNYFGKITDINEAKLIYRRLAMLNHPDRGGNPETMKNINNEFQELKRKLGSNNSMFDDLCEGDIVLINESNSIVTRVNKNTFIARSLYSNRTAVFCKKTGNCISNTKYKASSIIILNDVG